MSRSRRHTPIFGNSCSESERQFKAFEHRRERRAIRAALPDDDLPAPKAYGNPCAGPKDGKRWFSKARDKDMRK